MKKPSTLPLVLLLWWLASCEPAAPTVLVMTPTTLPPTPSALPTRLPPTAAPSPTTAPAAPLADARVRRALSLCTDRAALLQAAYPELIAVQAETGAFLGSPFRPQAAAGEFNPRQGRSLLEGAGLGADGKLLRLTLITTNVSSHKAWAALFQEQMRACGVEVTLQRLPAAELYDEQAGPLAARDFELAALAWFFPAPGTGPAGWRSLFSCRAVPGAGDGSGGQNIGGWCSPEVETALKRLATSLPGREMEGTLLLEQAFQAQAPAILLFQRPWFFAARADLRNFQPIADSPSTWNAAGWRVEGKESLTIGERSEPASLFPLDQAYVSSLVRALVAGVDAAFVDGAYRPVLLRAIPSIENGGVVAETVEVSAGDRVVDSRGNTAALAAGIRVVDTGGQEVTFDSAPIRMQQVIVTYTFIDSLRWSDGAPVTRADFELAYRALCSAELTQSYGPLPACALIDRVEFLDDSSYRVTWLPGFRSANLLLPPLGRLPAHQILPDGRKLADIPLSEWPSLEVVNRFLLGIGPYRLVDWKYGKEMKFSANPHYALGAPATPNLVIRFVEQNKTAQALLNGELDVLDTDSLLPEQVNSLVGKSDVRVYAIPSGIYEPIVFNVSGPQ